MKQVRARQIALVLFGGTGTRFGAPYPKQFVDLGSEPMFVVTLSRFSASPSVDEICVVVEPNTLGTCRDLILSRQIKKVRYLVKGGSTRQESVRLGLIHLASKGIKDDDLILIADGDRPNVNDKLIADHFITAYQFGAAVTAMPSVDSVLLGEDGFVKSYLDRNKVFFAQTPQTFKFKEIYKAHLKLANKTFTDDASLLVHLHKKVAIVEGSSGNIKITVPEDVTAFMALKEKKQ